VYGGSNVTAIGWSVTHTYYAVYASNERGPLTGFVLDDWTISDTCSAVSGTDSESISFQSASGRFSNMHATTSGVLLNAGTPQMTNGGGNSL
jgi:predicted aminopeptidase